MHFKEKYRNNITAALANELLRAQFLHCEIDYEARYIVLAFGIPFGSSPFRGHETTLSSSSILPPPPHPMHSSLEKVGKTAP